MKNKSSKDENAKKRGFYYTLYGSLCVAIAIAAVISIGQLMPGTSKAKDDGNLKPLDLSGLEQTGSSTDKSYLETDNLTADAQDIAAKNKATAPPPSVPNTPSEAPFERDPRNKPVTPNETQDEKPTTQAEAEPEYNKFTDGSKMSWPVIGEVVMPFSEDKFVYDKTLEYFRTNDIMSIAAEAGTQVKAAADGIVTEVTKTREQGNVVVVDNGNGWVTTYGQLQDGVLVKKGDVVKKSQVIGGVGSSSISSILLGDHLELKICKDSTAVNPLNILAE